jgi:putative flippase GtrA
MNVYDYDSTANKRKVGVFAKIKATFFTPQFLLFVFCGGCGTLVNFLFSLMFAQYIDSTLAYVGGYSISLFATYALNTYLVFKLPFSFLRFAKFVLSYIPNFIILLTFVAVLLNIFGLCEVFVYLAAALLGLPLTFVIVKIYAFANKEQGEKNNG